MKKICCPSLWHALIEHRDGLEWTPVSDGDAAGPIVVLIDEQHLGIAMTLPDGRDVSVKFTSFFSVPGGFVKLFHCPYCGAPI